jgi:hypothetical protein
MEDLNTVKLWEQSLRKEIEGFKACKARVLEDGSIPKTIKDRFLDVMRTLKMNMIQVMAKCSQLRTEVLPSKAQKVRIEKLRTEYEEMKASLEQLMMSVRPGSSSNRRTPSVSEVEVHSAVSKDLNDMRKISMKLMEEFEEHRHGDYEQRLEVLQSENQELRRTLERVIEDNSATFELLEVLKARVERLESSTEYVKDTARSSEVPKRRVLLKPSSHAEDLLRA